ncbi:ABC transporter permease [Indiicoccus explosivorum]|uniref:ABC transporter permease n=1 Tax=Indiicoccus explosivorum TaxID=1917864 RepID=UPI000B45352A|nr:FtsX-like permease family protein [Indiicoccus explosivorum]
MLFKDQIGFIRQHMKRNRLRTAMTVLAATMGCAFLIVLASVGFGLHKTLMDELLSNQTVTEIQIHGKEDSGEPITAEEQELIRQLPGVDAVVARSYLESPSRVLLDDRLNRAQIILTDAEQEAKAELDLSAGALPSSRNEVIVGYHFAENLLTEQELIASEKGESPAGYRGDLIGETIRLEVMSSESEEPGPETWEFTIAGIAEEPAKDWRVDNLVLVDESFREEFPVFTAPEGEEVAPYFEINAYAEDLAAVEAVTESLKTEGYYVYSVTEEMTTMNLFFNVLKAGLIFVGTIAVLIASIGIFNTMTMAVTERTREIGVMKAIGAQPKLIQRLFLMESAWIGIVGTMLAVVISFAVSALVNQLIPNIVLNILAEDGAGAEGMNIIVSDIPWQLVVIASFISIGVAMVSGWRPARKATEIDVIQALRQEL